ncbi:hypothetical protein IV500_10600 [Paeniglutamicibacter antarcticus]|uniref:Uncharacterized protein n=1 Tax=Arthrobacter terrae TaxID=2935737 RepID=A0A931CQW3_9MICC|nr:hypothetical protein [Arthrobacter terrae]MBG0739834.1 hypothetical protein [Arthrobacter terrae]
MNNNSEIPPWTGAPAVRPPQKRTGRRRVAAAAAGASLLAAGLFGVSAASAADATPSAATPTSAASAPSPGSTTAAAGHAQQNRTSHVHATVREELRIDLRAKTGFGDTAHVAAYGLIHHPKAFAKLPANLQTDLKALEAAPAAERDADAVKIKDTALNGGYGAAIQTEAKTIQTKMAQTPAN